MVTGSSYSKLHIALIGIGAGIIGFVQHGITIGFKIEGCRKCRVTDIRRPAADYTYIDPDSACSTVSHRSAGDIYRPGNSHFVAVYIQLAARVEGKTTGYRIGIHQYRPGFSGCKRSRYNYRRRSSRGRALTPVAVIGPVITYIACPGPGLRDRQVADHHKQQR